MKTVCFNHGKESGPWGRKITRLAEVARRRGLAVISPDYRFTYDPDRRIDHLYAERPPSGGELILVGSSMGGYVAAVASGRLRPAGLFLMAPALYMPGYEADPDPQADTVAVVHGWRDAIVPVANSWRFAGRHRAALHVLDAEHALEEVLPQIEALFDEFLARLTG